MIIDHEATIADNIAFDATSPAFALNLPTPVMGNWGEPILLLVTGKDLVAPDGLILHVAGDLIPGGTFAVDEMTVTLGAIAAMSGGVIFGLPTNISPYLKVTLELATAGTYSVNVIHKGL